MKEMQKMKVEIRGQGKVHISGYVNAVDRFSRPIRASDGKKFVEKIKPGAFQRAIDEADDIDVMLNHRRTVGSVKSGGITLKEDGVGLFFDGDIYDKEIEEKAKRGKLRGWSFGFRLLKKSDKDCERADADFERTVEDMNLLEVSIIDDMAVPCYNGTSIMTRAQGDTVETLFRGGETQTEYDTSRDKESLKIRKRKNEIIRKL